MSDPLSGTWRGRPAPLRPSWRLPALSRRRRTLLVVAAPVALFGVFSWLLGDFLLALIAAGVPTVVAAALWTALVVLDDRDHWRDEAAQDVAELGRRFTSQALSRRQLDANTDDTARLADRVRFLEDLTLGVPGQRDSDRRTS